MAMHDDLAILRRTMGTHGSTGEAWDALKRLEAAQPERPVGCACARDREGNTTSSTLCPIHADVDPCTRMSQITGTRRKGTIKRGTCTNCGWTAPKGE